eukprot:7117104-Ditylum_brightwellii.AAC.1
MPIPKSPVIQKITNMNTAACDEIHDTYEDFGLFYEPINHKEELGVEMEEEALPSKEDFEALLTRTEILCAMMHILGVAGQRTPGIYKQLDQLIYISLKCQELMDTKVPPRNMQCCFLLCSTCTGIMYADLVEKEEESESMG